MGQTVGGKEADHPDDHGSARVDAGNVHHPEVRSPDRNDDQALLKKHVLSVPDYVMDGLDGPDQICEPLVDRGCVLLDGKCGCPRPVYDYCKYTQERGNYEKRIQNNE